MLINQINERVSIDFQYPLNRGISYRDENRIKCNISVWKFRIPRISNQYQDIIWCTNFYTWNLPADF